MGKAQVSKYILAASRTLSCLTVLKAFLKSSWMIENMVGR